MTLTTQIQRGSFGCVWETDQPGVVAKCPHANEEAIKRIFAEAAIHKDLDHPHIVRFFAFSQSSPMAIFLEKLSGKSLGDAFNRDREAIDAKLVLHQVLLALAYLQEKGIVHADLHMDNVFWGNMPGLIQVGDFGNASKGPTPNHPPVYAAAPEALWYRDYTEKGDMWSFGVMAWSLLRRDDFIPDLSVRDPHKLEAQAIFCLKARMGNPPPQERKWEVEMRNQGGSAYLSSRKLYALRCSIPFSVQHWHWEEAPPFLAQIFQYDAEARPSPAEVLQDPYFTGVEAK